MRKLGSILIIIGIVVASYPLADNFYSHYWQQKLFKQFQASGELTSQQHYRNLNQVFISDIKVDHETEPNQRQQQIRIVNEVIGIIEIAKIDLALPILNDTDEISLKKGAGHLKGTSVLGEIGNSVVAAHRGHSYGRLFNRLNEVDIEDEIIIKTQKGIYTYRVFDKKIVKPNDLSVLDSNDQEKILTLITCEPILNPTHRIIIHAKIQA